MILLSKVEAAFTVPTRGCVVVPVAPIDPHVQVKAGDAIQLRGPSGCVDAHISSVEWLTRQSNGCQFALLLSGEIDCSQIPKDAEIWIDQSSTTSE